MRDLLVRWRWFPLTGLLYAADSLAVCFWSCGRFLKWWRRVGS